MQKYILITFISIVMILTLLGLLTNHFLEPKNTKDIPSNIDGITLSLNNSQISIDEPILEVVVENASDLEVKYGTDWTIERYANERWKKVFPIREASFTSQLITVEPHHSKTEIVDLKSYLKDKVMIGKYRIIKETVQPVHQLGVTFEIK